MRRLLFKAICRFAGPPAAGSLHRLLGFGLVLLAFFFALVVGQFSAVAGVLLQDKPMLLIGLPLILLLGFLFLFDRQVLLFLVFLTRAGLDPILDLTKMPLGGGMGLGALLNGLIIVLAFATVIEKGASRLKAAWFFLPFLVLLVIGVLRSPLLGDAVKLTLSIVTGYAAFVIGAYMSGEKAGADRVVRLVLLSSILPSAMALIMWGADFSFATSQSFESFEGAEANRFSGPFTHPNIMAFYVLLVIVATLYLWRTYRHVNKPWVNLVAPAYLVLLVFFLLLTKTRSAWAACAFVFLLYGIFFERRFLAYLAVGMLGSLTVPSVQERLVDVLEGESYLQYARLNSFAWRTLLWEQALAWMPPSDYLMGMGFEAFRYHSTEFFELANRGRIGAHNVYVEVFFELGLVGLFAFLLLFLVLIARIYKVLTAGKLLASSGLLLIGLYLTVCYSDNMFAYLVVNLYFWLMLGAIFAVGLTDFKKARS